MQSNDTNIKPKKHVCSTAEFDADEEFFRLLDAVKQAANARFESKAANEVLHGAIYYYRKLKPSNR